MRRMESSVRRKREAVSTRSEAQRLMNLPAGAPMPIVHDAGPIDPDEARRLFEEFEVAVETSEKEAPTALKRRLRSAVESPGAGVSARTEA